MGDTEALLLPLPPLHHDESLPDLPAGGLRLLQGPPGGGGPCGWPPEGCLPPHQLGCQCSSLTFADSAGVVQGNCKTVDGTGARWCYVDAAYGSSCQDLTPSARFPANPWSYEACATPAIGSYECPTVVATPAVVNVVPVHHPEDHHDDHHPEVPLDCRVPVHGCPGFAPPVVAPSGVGVPVHVFPDNVRAEFPEGEERQNLEVKGDQVRFGEPTK